MQQSNKILLVHLFSNGDCLYATTIAKQIKKDYPDHTLTWMIAGFCKSIINNNPNVDEIIVVDEITKSDTSAYRKLERQLKREEQEGKWKKVFITHNSLGDNQSLYDGTIRGMVLKAYPNPITVPLQPELVLYDWEIENVRKFAEKKILSSFKNVILWEYAPLSGQVELTYELVRRVAEKIVEDPNTCIILTSANRFESTKQIIDASSLSIRENAALTHYCNLLIGCSSGITWLSTSTAAKELPTLQLLNPDANFRNIPSEDYRRYGGAIDKLIELSSFDEEKIIMVVKAIMNNGFVYAKSNYNESMPMHFKTTRKIVYNLLCYLKFKPIAKHFQITTQVYGIQYSFLKEFLLGFVTFPFKLIGNKWRKRTQL